MKTLSEIHAWDHFIKEFQKVFHTEWADTVSRLPSLGGGTFLQPANASATASWETRNKLLGLYNKILQPVELAVIEARKIEEVLKKGERWITGEVLADKALKFRMLEEVDGNPVGSVCMLGASSGLEGYFFPVFMRAAERQIKIRLYGTFIPTPGPITPDIPPASFIAWKFHSPDEPDELPADKKFDIHPGDRISGYNVRKISAHESLVQQVMNEFDMLQHHPRSCVIIMNGFIELLVNTLIEERCKGMDKKSVSTHGRRIGVLHDRRLIDDDDFQRLEWFRKLRNDAAHEAVFDIAKKSFDLFKGTRFEKPFNFPILCMDVFVKFWNKNKDTFAKLSPKGQSGEIVGSVLEGRVFDASTKPQ